MNKNTNSPLQTAQQLAATAANEDADAAPAPSAGGPAGDGTIQAGYAAIPKQPAPPAPVMVDLTKRGAALPKVTVKPRSADPFFDGTILAGMGLYFEGKRILQPSHQANVRKLFEAEDVLLVTPEEIAQLQTLQANWERIMQHITEHTSETVRTLLQQGRQKLTDEPTSENIQSFKAVNQSREHLESQYREIRVALKQALQTFDKEEVSPLTSSILQRAADELLPVIEAQQQREQEACELVGIPFSESPCLVALKYAAAKLVSHAKQQPGSVYPPSPRTQLAPVFTLPAIS